MAKSDSKQTRARRPRAQVVAAARKRSPRRAVRALPVLAPERSQVPCLSCGLCCSYIALEIDGPATLRGATDILWYLYHQGVAIYFDGDEWMVQLDTVCRHLKDDNRCGIYETRPQICREFDETTCEVNSEDVGTTFYNAREFLGYLAQHHKRIHTLVQKRYVPADEMLNGHRLGKRRFGPFQPRLDAARRLGLAPA